jgi:hypothetical protein
MTYFLIMPALDAGIVCGRRFKRMTGSMPGHDENLEMEA